MTTSHVVLPKEIDGYEILPTGGLCHLGRTPLAVARVPELDADMDELMRGSSLTPPEKFMLKLLFVSLPKGWNPAFGAFCPPKTWVTGPEDLRAWTSGLAVLLGGVIAGRRVIFSDTYDAERMASSRQVQGAVPPFFQCVLEGLDLLPLQNKGDSAVLACQYAFDLGLIDKDRDGQAVILTDTVAVLETQPIKRRGLRTNSGIMNDRPPSP